MKPVRIALYLAAAGLFSACAYIPPQEVAARVVSPDYTATGGLVEARAYVYGSVTLLDLGGSAPAVLSIKDGTGASVNYERVGRYYRLARVVDSFTVWANGQSVTFSAPMTTRIFSATTKATPDKVPELAEPAVQSSDEDVAALLKLCESQLADVRRLLDEGSRNPKATGQELFEVHQRLHEIEARMLKAAAAIVQVSFPTGGTAFRPSPAVAEVLIVSGKAADSINVRGRTDSRVAGPADSRIALARAMAAQKFLVDHGISPEKIKVFSRADGDFAAPGVTKEGRAMNRRVEIEFINARIAEHVARAALDMMRLKAVAAQ
jgi:outer membrane protein OmpA-like peptidoglycan-associated protein